MRKKSHKPMGEREVRIIKIGADAVFEFLYEKFIDIQEDCLDVDPTSVSNSFYYDRETGNFIFCAGKYEDSEGNIITLPKEIDLSALVNSLPDTAESVLSSQKIYREYTKDELIALSGGSKGC